MSKPSSLKVGPFTSNVMARKRYLIPYLIIIWMSIFIVQIEIWVYWNLFFYSFQFLVFLPLLFFSLYLSIIFVSLLEAKFLLIILNTLHKPREGVFLRDISDRDYRYWSLRNVIKKWPIWLSHKFPFPFIDNICFKMFGVKTKFRNSLFEGWVDCEFIEFGSDIIIGQGSIIQSSTIIGNHLIIKKTILKDNVKIGAHTVVAPGTLIGKNTILAANSTTTVGQTLDEGWIYLGIPAKKFKENRYDEEDLEHILEKSIENIEELRKLYELLYFKRHDTSISVKDRSQKKKVISQDGKGRTREKRQIKTIAT